MRFRIVLIASAFLVLASLVLGRDASAASALCPYASVFASRDGTTYAAEFASTRQFSGAVSATFYTRDASYTAGLPALTIATEKKGDFHSAPVAFLSPTSDPIIGIQWTFGDPNGECNSQYTSVAALANSPRVQDALAQLDSSVKPIPLAFAKSETPLTCRSPFVVEGVDGLPAPVEYPPIARMEGASGTARVLVNLAPDGTIVSASIAQSTGNRDLDRAAISAAKNTHFHPLVFRCVPMAGRYLFSVQFSQQR